MKQQRDALLVRGNQPARPQPEVQIEPSDLTKVLP